MRVLVAQSVSNTLPLHGLEPARLVCPWDSPGKNTAVGCHFLLQGIFPTQEMNPGFQHCWKILYQLSYAESPESPSTGSQSSGEALAVSISSAGSLLTVSGKADDPVSLELTLVLFCFFCLLFFYTTKLLINCWKERNLKRTMQVTS